MAQKILFKTEKGMIDSTGEFHADDDGDYFDNEEVAREYMALQFAADKLRYSEEYKESGYKIAARLSRETTESIETLGV